MSICQSSIASCLLQWSDISISLPSLAFLLIWSIIFGSTATWLVISCTLHCNEINSLSILLNSWSMYTLIISSSCSTLYNVSVLCNDVRLCVWNLLIGVTCRRLLSLLQCYPIPPRWMPNTKWCIDNIINVVFWGIVRLLYFESILVAECISLDLLCGGSRSEMLTTY